MGIQKRGIGYVPNNAETLGKITEVGGIPYFDGRPFSTGGGSFDPPNKATLLKIGESGGQPTFNGVPIPAGTNPVAVDRRTENLFDKSTATVGQLCPPIPVKEGYNYTFFKSDGINTPFNFYDASNNLISGSSGVRQKAPANAAFLRVMVANTNALDSLMVIEGTSVYSDYVPYTQKELVFQGVQGLTRSQFYERTVWVLGDSISTGWGDGAQAGNNYASLSYSYIIGRQRRINIQNESVSGYTVDNIYTNKALNMPPTQFAPAAITIMVGTNNHGFNNALGTINDTPAVGSTFYAGLRNLIEFLQNRFPQTKIGLITPIQRNGTGNGNGNVANAAGFTLRQYCDAVVAIGKFYSLPVLDWYYNLGFTPFIDAQKNTFYTGSPSDGTHPNNLGHTYMAPKWGNFIETL